MRPTLVTAALVATLALTGLASVDRARATEAAPKEADRASIGTTGQPDAQPADPRAPKLAKAPGIGSARSAATLPLGVKPQPIMTSAPLDASQLSAAQRAKLAAIDASASAPAEPAMSASGKPANLSTILPPAAGAHVMSADESLKAKLASVQASLATPAAGFARLNSSTAALGVIPRPEWLGLLEKPKDVSTVVTPAAGARVVAPPSAAELQRRAAPTLITRPGSKPAAVTTSLPRDPSVRADAAKPSPSDGGKQGVQP